ncbi:hypothetical protein SRHO_G00280100 [Serrasalmus rhombeus]
MHFYWWMPASRVMWVQHHVRWCLVFFSVSCTVFSHTCGNIDLVLCECGLANCVTVRYLLAELDILRLQSTL